KEIRTSTELADTFFISQSTLNRLFRKYVGLSVFQIIDARRLSHAENLLRNGSSVMDACFQSGFTDCSKFIILFKKTFGVTPLRYKRKHQITPEEPKKERQPYQADVQV
ncbi:MAG: helix-turn-helix transcriptional regulator, partial [Clostridia bacterium]|nr:helix-turn-helix transcriptional regulator [Clostridia bacterium]